MTNDRPTLPPFFEGLLADQYDAADVERILDGCAVRRATTLRANALKADRAEIAGALDVAGIAWEGVPWYGDAFVLEAADDAVLRELPAYEQGKLYVQSLSSMIPPLVLDPQPGIDVCDMCAAPGGKTTQIVALTGNGAYVTACEMHEPRAQKLEHNLQLLGARNVVVMRTDARRLDDFFSFDRVLVDAPCSGSGTLRAGAAHAERRFTMKLVEKSAKSQAALLDKALRLVKPGGVVVYSTCSVLRCENEDIVEGALKRNRRRGVFEIQPVALGDVPVTDGDGNPRDAAAVAADVAVLGLPMLPTRLEGTLCLAPTERYEGFFVARILRKA